MQIKDRELLADLMKQQKRSGRDVAKAAGWKSHTYIQRLLRGEARTVEVEPACRIAVYLNRMPHELFVAKSSIEWAQVAKQMDRAA
jgi:transcriptional regulator with XRE-family HTH domain